MLRFSDGSGSCADQEQPHHRGWSGRGPRASGRVQDLGRPEGRLTGFSDSDAESGRNDSPRRMDSDDGGAGGAADHQGPAEPEQAPADAARPPSPPQVHVIHTIQTQYIRYIHIYKQIHTIQTLYIQNTYIYMQILTNTNKVETADLRQVFIPHVFHAS